MARVVLFQQRENLITRLGQDQMTIASKSIIVVLPGCEDFTQLFQYFLSHNIILLFRESLPSFQHCRPRQAAVSEPVKDLGLRWDRMLSCPVLLA
jgi:hypothetical protein